MLKWLRGKKTYIVAAGAALSAIGAFASGQISLVELIGSLFASGGLASVRNAIPPQ